MIKLDTGSIKKENGFRFTFVYDIIVVPNLTTGLQNILLMYDSGHKTLSMSSSKNMKNLKSNCKQIDFKLQYVYYNYYLSWITMKVKINYVLQVRYDEYPDCFAAIWAAAKSQWNLFHYKNIVFLIFEGKIYSL